jgi:hypothetical protein
VFGIDPSSTTQIEGVFGEEFSSPILTEVSIP